MKFKMVLADGGKIVQAADGRIIEYFVYGSDAKDARVMLRSAAAWERAEFTRSSRASWTS